MSLRISSLPAGLISLLNLQTTGRGPQALLEDISPTLELMQMFVANRVERLEAGPTAVVAGGMNAFAVPAGELWYVTTLAARLTAVVPGAGSLRAAPGYGPLANVVLAPFAGLSAFTTGETAQWGAPLGLWVSSGGVLGSYVAQVTGAMNVVHTVTFLRLKI